MTPADLVARVQAIADEPNAKHAQRRRGMSAAVAQRIVDEVVAEALAVVEPFALNQWGGDVVLRRVRDLRGNGRQASRFGAGDANGAKSDTDHG